MRALRLSAPGPGCYHLRVLLSETNCRNCGAPVQFASETPRGTQPSPDPVAPGAGTGRIHLQDVRVCAFCGTQFVVEAPRQVVLDPEGSGLSVVPFSVDRSSFEETALRWLSEGTYTPDDAIEDSTLEHVQGTYLPFYRYTGTFAAHWTARIGYERHVRDRSGSTKTKVDWRTQSGTHRGRFDELGLASPHLADENLMQFAESSPFERGRQLAQADARGFGIEPYELEEHACFEARVQPRLEQRAKAEIETRLPGDEHRDLRMHLDDAGYRSERIYLPFWIATFSYRGERFRAMVCGRDAGRAGGNRPVDRRRRFAVRLAMAPFFPLLVATIAAALAPFVFPDLDPKRHDPLVSAGMWLTGGSFLFGIGLRGIVVGRSLARRQKRLAARLARR